MWIVHTCFLLEKNNAPFRINGLMINSVRTTRHNVTRTAYCLLGNHSTSTKIARAEWLSHNQLSLGTEKSSLSLSCINIAHIKGKDSRIKNVWFVKICVSLIYIHVISSPAACVYTITTVWMMMNSLLIVAAAAGVGHPPSSSSFKILLMIYC